MPVLLIAAVGIAGITYNDWKQCSIVTAAADQLQPDVEAAEQSMLLISESEKRTEALKAEIEEMNALQQAEDPLKLLNVISRSATDMGDQLAVSRFDHFNLEENTQTTDAAIPTTVQASAAELSQKRFRTVMHVNGLAVSDISVARFMNSLRASGGFQSVALKSSQPSSVGGPLQREFVVECVREGRH
jgi:Tfp pilus assembly protein PilN